MDTKSFKDLCDRLLKKNGFKKRRNMYYKDGIDGIRCGVYLQRSAYGKLYYFNCKRSIVGIPTSNSRS